MCIILKMNIVTIHYLSDFHTRERLQISFRFSVCGTIIVVVVVRVNLLI
jgi:hypothetical protein